MFRRISVWCLALGMVLGVASIAHARSAPTATQSQFAYSGKLPKVVSTKLALDELFPQQKKQLNVATRESASKCGSKTCDVVIMDDGVGPGLRIMGLMLNIFLPLAVGSWVVGDRFGAYFGTSAQLAGLGLFLIGYLIGYSTAAATAGLTLAAIGITLMAAGWILPMITVLLFRSSRIRRRYHRRHRRYRRRHYRRRYDRSSAQANVYSNSMAKAFQPTAQVKATAFTF